MEGEKSELAWWRKSNQRTWERWKERRNVPACVWMIRSTHAAVEGRTSGARCSVRPPCPSSVDAPFPPFAVVRRRRARLAWATKSPHTRLVVHAAPSVRLENVHWSSSRPRSNPTVPGFSDGSTSFLRSPRRTVRETSETPSLTSPQPTVRNVRENPTRTEPNRIPPHVRIFSTGQSWPAP